MTFPHYFHAFGHAIHPHPVMELIGYTGGFQLYLYLRRRWPGPRLPLERNLWVIVGAIGGALVGSKLLAWAESWPDYLAAWRAGDVGAILGGKTIVGGLLGGWAGVEVAKQILGVGFSTGDAMVFPLALGMSIGRIGCFLTGLSDHTCGNHTSVPWAVDFGDGPRHPAQLYDIAFLIVLSLALAVLHRWPHGNGRLWRLFVPSYCLYRFAVEFIKPTGPKYLGVSGIQIACLAGAAAAGWLLYGQKLIRAPVLTRMH